MKRQNQDILFFWTVSLGLPLWIVLAAFWTPAAWALAAVMVLAIWFIAMTVLANIMGL